MANASLPEFQAFPNSPSFQDLSNRVFGRWTVLGYLGRRKSVDRWWCECACGVRRGVKGWNLLKGLSTSCGCYGKMASLTHGMHRTPEYDAFIAARQRCVNPHTKHYESYGGRGIEFRFTSFEEFYAHIGSRPSADYSLDRIDVNGHYETGNVRWASSFDQQRNRRDNRIVAYEGLALSIAEWAERKSMKASLLRHRLNADWCLECVFNLPLHSSCRHRTHGTKYDPKPKRVEAWKSTKGETK